MQLQPSNYLLSFWQRSTLEIPPTLEMIKSNQTEGGGYEESLYSRRGSSQHAAGRRHSARPAAESPGRTDQNHLTLIIPPACLSDRNPSISGHRNLLLKNTPLIFMLQDDVCSEKEVTRRSTGFGSNCSC